MPNITPNLIEQFNQIQHRVWEVVTSAVTEVCSKNIRFIDPLTVSLPPHDVSEELAGQKLVIQFAFDSIPDQKQILVLSQEILIGIAQLFRSEPITDATEELITAIQPIISAIVEGICTVAGEKRNETITGLNITSSLETFNLVENLQYEDEIIRVTAVINFNELNGNITWLINQSTTEFFLGRSIESIKSDSEDTYKLSQKQHSSHQDDIRSMDMLYDIPLEISVELGRVKMLVKDIIELSNGSIIEMDKIAGEPVDIMVNGKTVAKGEVIVIEDNFGVRITEILNPKERLQKI